MKVKELIEELKTYNQEADVNVIAHCFEYDFSIASGGSDGSNKLNCDTVSFYVDKLCTNERPRCSEAI